MMTQEFLNLQCIQLESSQEWSLKGDHLSFVFPKAGIGKWVAGAGSQQLASGDLLVLNPYSGGKVCPADSGAVDFACFSVQMEHLFPLFESSEICLLQNISDGFRTPRLFPAGSPIAKECHRRLTGIPAQASLDHRSHLLQVAAAVLTDAFSHANAARVGFSRPEDHLIQVFKKLTATELLSLAVGDLAAKFGCSRRHLNRLFHQYFGISVAALRMEMRLLKSVSLLRDPDAKVIRVAEDCGFNQLGLFNTCFKRRFGASPGEWRKKHLRPVRSLKPVAPAANSCPLQINGLCPLNGSGMDSNHAMSCEVAAPPKSSPVGAANSAKVPRKRGSAEPGAAAGQQLIIKTSQKRVVVRIGA
jgi:AraC-like DNA-binding protein